MSFKKNKIVVIVSLLILGFGDGFSQNNSLYAETGKVYDLGNTERLEKVVGNTKNNFFVLTQNYKALKSIDKLHGISKNTLEELWVHDIQKSKYTSTPFIEVFKQGILLTSFAHNDQEDLVLNAVLVDPNTGMSTKLDNEFLVKKANEKANVISRLFSKDSSKIYIFTGIGIGGMQQTVTCIRTTDIKVLWSKPWELNEYGKLQKLYCMQMDNDDNLYTMIEELKGESYETYLGKYNFATGTLEKRRIDAGANKTVNADLYTMKKDRKISDSDGSNAREHDLISEFNAVKMLLGNNNKIFVAGFYEEEKGKSGYFIKTVSQDGLRVEQETSGNFPDMIDAKLAKNDFSKTDFYVQDFIMAGNTFHLIGQQIKRAYKIGYEQTEAYDYIVLSFEDPAKVVVSSLPPQEVDFLNFVVYPLYWFKYNNSLYISLVKPWKKTENFKGTTIGENYKALVLSSEGKKGVDFFVKFGSKGIEDVKILEATKNKEKSGMQFGSILGSAVSFNFEKPYAIVPDGSSIILGLTNIIRPNAFENKYCFGRISMK